jgi:hypothetical protein
MASLLEDIAHQNQVQVVHSAKAVNSLAGEVFSGGKWMSGDMADWPRKLFKAPVASCSCSTSYCRAEDDQMTTANRTLPLLLPLFCWLAFASLVRADDDQLQWVRVAPDSKTFLLEGSGRRFTPWGFNYDHDEEGRLLEDYWDGEWPKVEKDFAAMRQLGANVVRIHLQLGKLLDGPAKPNDKALNRLSDLLKLAEKDRLYLDLTGLGCYHKKDVPDWYDKLSEKGRWDVQAHFWEAVAERCANSPAIFCFDLMNEPVVPGGKRQDGDWLGPAFAGKHFVQCITLDQGDRERPAVASAWVRFLAAAIRRQDRRHLITVGMVSWSLDRPGLTSGFVPEKVAGDLDFLCVHLYPEKGKVDEALKTLAGFSVGKPVVIEETFPLRCPMKDFEEFIDKSGMNAAGWIGFYWGKTPEELRKSKTIADAMTLGWLDFFERKGKILRTEK